MSAPDTIYDLFYFGMKENSRLNILTSETHLGMSDLTEAMFPYRPM